MIMRILLVIILLSEFSTGLSAQGTWVQKANFPGASRCYPMNFSIGSKGYIGAGGLSVPYLTDVWEYDKTIDAWTQMASFPGPARYSTICLSIGNKGYFGCGVDNGFVYQKDFWEFDPIFNSWTQVASLPGLSRWGAVCFSIGFKGYLALGQGVQGVNYVPLKELLEYDALQNTWTQKANFPGPPRTCSSGFSVGNTGYIGVGHYYNPTTSQMTDYNDFWKWEQSSDTWTQLPNFPGGVRGDGVGFSVGSFGYIGTGQKASSQVLFNYKDFFQFDPANVVWTKMTDVPGNVRAGAAGFPIGCNGYVGVGEFNSATTMNDFWEFTPPFPSAALAGVNTICSGDSTYLFASGGLSYQWSTGGTSHYISVQPTATTVYSVIALDGCGSDTASMQVVVIPTPVADFETRVNPCRRCVEITDRSQDGVIWNWNFGDSSTSTTPNNQHCYADTGIYQVSLFLTSATGKCWGKDSALVQFIDVDEVNMVVPNVFTPNDDGQNDVFYTSLLDTCLPYRIIVYDRWGVLKFDSNISGQYWDGKNPEGYPVEQGTYYYVLTNGITLRKGYVTVLR